MDKINITDAKPSLRQAGENPSIEYNGIKICLHPATDQIRSIEFDGKRAGYRANKWAVEFDGTEYFCDFYDYGIFDGGKPNENVILPSSRIRESKNKWSTEYRAGDMVITFRYEIPDGQSLIKIGHTVAHAQNKAFVLNSVTPLSMVLDGACSETFPVYTMSQAPFGAVCRGNDCGIIYVTENPFMTLTAVNPKVTFNCRTRLKIRAGEVYEGETCYIVLIPAFSGFVTGRYLPASDGSMCERGGLINPNNIVWDNAELKALRGLMSQRAPLKKAETFIYCEADWLGLAHYSELQHPNRAESDAEAEIIRKQYAALMDNMLEIGVDAIWIDQSFRNDAGALPTDSKKGWSLHKYGEPIIQTAREKGLKYGLYNGGGNRPEENPCNFASNNAFFPDRKSEWKIKTPGGAPLDGMIYNEGGVSNCLCVKEFEEWYAETLISTVKNLDMFMLGFDSGNFWQIQLGHCFAGNHDHLPGDCRYAQFRAFRRIVQKIRRDAPEDLLLLTYWGAKRYGPFGTAAADFHENYYENAVFAPEGYKRALGEQHSLPATFSGYYDSELLWPVCTDIRTQCWYSCNERFMPAHTTYNLIDNRREELIAAISTGGKIPIRSFISADNISFFKKWIAFAKEYRDLLQSTYVGLYGPPRRGCVDGAAHIDGAKGGFVFLFNPNKKRVTAELPLTKDIGLEYGGDTFAVCLRRPERGEFFSINGKTEFTFGQTLVFDVPAGALWVLEIFPAAKRKKPVRVRELKATGTPLPAFVTAEQFKAQIKVLPPLKAWDTVPLADWVFCDNF